MLQITLTQKAHPTPLTEMSEEELFRAATYCWVMNPARARKERFAIVIGEGQYLMAIGVTDIVLAERAASGSTKDDRYEIVGEILSPGHPVHDEFVGMAAIGTRNPVRYFESAFDLSQCRCGCGESVRADFLPGHDQRAIHARIANFGSVAKFLDWFDETYSA